MQWLTEETGWLLPEDDEQTIPASPEKLPALGAGLSSAAASVMVGCADSDAASAAAVLLCGGIAAAGGTACFAPDCIPAALQVGAALHHCGILAHCGGNKIHLFSYGLLPLPADQHNMIYAGAAAPRWMRRTEYGSITADRSLCGIYAAQLRRRLPEQLSCKPEIQSGSPLLCAVLRPIFSGGYGRAVTFRLSADGRRASLYSEDTGWLFYEKLLLMVTQQVLRQGNPVALPCWLPHIAEQMAAEYGQQILRYASHPDGKDVEARRLAAEQRFTLDGAVLCAELLRIAAETGIPLKAWADSLPPCWTVRRILRTDSAADAALHCAAALHAVPEPDGLRIRTTSGEALLHPSGGGKAVSVLVEARSMEAASELAGDISALLNGQHLAPV